MKDCLSLKTESVTLRIDFNFEICTVKCVGFRCNCNFLNFSKKVTDIQRYFRDNKSIIYISRNNRHANQFSIFLELTNMKYLKYSPEGTLVASYLSGNKPVCVWLTFHLQFMKVFVNRNISPRTLFFLFVR